MAILGVLGVFPWQRVSGRWAAVRVLACVHNGHRWTTNAVERCSLGCVWESAWVWFYARVRLIPCVVDVTFWARAAVHDACVGSCACRMVTHKTQM